MVIKNRLLVVSNGYPSRLQPYCDFVKSYVDAVKSKFVSVTVICPIPWIPYMNLLKSILPNKYKLYAKLRDYHYDNVTVNYIHYFHLPLKSYRDIRNKNAKRTVLRHIDELKFNIVHAHFTCPSGYIANAISKKNKVPVILTVHESRDYFNSEVQSDNLEITNTWKHVDCLTRVNKQDLEILKRYNHKSIYLPNGYDESKFFCMKKKEAREKLRLMKSRILVHVGSMIIKKKNQLNIIKAIEKIRNVHLFLIGEGKDKQLLEEYILNNNLEYKVTLVGPVPNRELVYWYNSADLVLLPSISESFGVVLIESIACGTPVVTSVNGGSEEIINSKCGMLIRNPKSIPEIRSKIVTALRKKWDRNEISKHSQNYSLKVLGRHLEKIYGELI